MVRIMIDTGAIYAFVVRSDVHYKAACSFLREVLKGKNVLVLADVVFFETMTLLKARLGVQLALRVGQELRRNPLYVWTPLGVDRERETWSLFQQYKDKGWSYTDTALLALSQKLGISKVFAFDDHFEQMPGVTRVPR